MHSALIALACALGGAWLWFLARARRSGGVKRLALRVTLLAVLGALVFAAARRGLFVRASLGFQLALLVTMLAVAVGYLYLIRFCGTCGMMVRNLRPATCPRCGAFLPIHGMSARLRRAGDDRRWDPLQRRERRAPLE